MGPLGGTPISGYKEAKNGHWYKTKVVYQGGLYSRKIVHYNILPKMGLSGVPQFQGIRRPKIVKFVNKSCLSGWVIKYKNCPF